MGNGFRGAYVISWAQAELDGLTDAPIRALVVGGVWSWSGEILRVDGPSDVLSLGDALGAEDLRQRAARMVTRLVGAAFEPGRVSDGADLHPLSTCFVVTDGTALYTVTLIEAPGGGQPLLMFVNDIPPPDQDLFVVEVQVAAVDQANGRSADGGVICFTPDTWIETPEGPRRVQDLREGSRVNTRDNGPQDILWVGSRRMTGARLFVMPRLRPIRIDPGALGDDRPDQALVVSPDHQILISGRGARDLFNTSEVLVAAKYLVNDRDIRVDTARRHVTYIHLLLPRHDVLMANGVPCESFHPAQANLDTLRPEDLERLQDCLPELQGDPARYGAQARRSLSAGEAEILGHVA